MGFTSRALHRSAVVVPVIVYIPERIYGGKMVVLEVQRRLLGFFIFFLSLKKLGRVVYVGNVARVLIGGREQLHYIYIYIQGGLLDSDWLNEHSEAGWLW
ncbi:hypothetical protein GQ457_05G002360 [Hibiscus cannabinus]